MKQKLRVLLLAFLGTSVVTLRAQVFEVLDSLGSGQGTQPYAGLTLEGSVLFGTTSGGGLFGNGNVFKLNSDGSGLTDLYDFTTPTQASSSRAGLLLSGSTLYGAGYQGGATFGTIYAISTAGKGYTNLHVFAGGSDGSHPRGSLVLSSNVLYGTTQYGTNGGGNGTVFSVKTDSTGFTTLFTFAGTNGSQPYASLVLSNNVLYGTTYFGGSSNLGTVFSLTTDGKIFTLLHSFSNTDGALPGAGLVLSGGTLFGTTVAGGALGNGTIFSIGTNGSGFQVVHSFAAGAGDGAAPLSSLVISNNFLFGTTSSGGASGDGTVFAIATNGLNLSLLYNFSGGGDGGLPVAPLVFDGNRLFGTAVNGGANGKGAIFEVKLAGVVIVQQPAPMPNNPTGTNVTFFSHSGYSLTSAQALEYQWRLNGVNIPGATQDTLVFNDVQVTNGGSVTVAFSDGTDAPNSTPALFLVPAPLLVTNNTVFGNRFHLTGSSGTVDGNNTQGAEEIGEPVIIAGDPGGKPVWFSWQPQSSGIAVVSTVGSAFDTIMGVYLGTSVANLVREPSAISDDDSGGYLTSKVAFNCVAGQEYEIVVDGYYGDSGSIVLTWGVTPTNAILPEILTAPPALTVTSNGASVTLVCVPNTGVPVWFFNGQPTSITGTNNVISPVTFGNVGTWVAQVTSGGWTVSTQPSRIEIDTLEDGTTDTNSTAFYKFFDSVVATFVQTSLPVVRRQDGGDTRGFSVSQVFSTVGAQGEPGEPNIAGQIGGSPVWYKYVAPTNGSLLVNTAGSSFNTLLGVFTGPGDSFATLTSLGQSYTSNRVLRGQPQISVANVPAGQTNYIVVDGYQGTSGTVNLTIGLGTPVSLSTAPASQFVLAGTNATFTATASGSTPLSYAWQYAGANIAGATNSSLTITNVQQGNIGSYTVLVSNLVSRASNSVTLMLATAPVITTQPLSHTIPANTTATLSVGAAADGPLSYQWLFDGTNTGSSASSLSISNFASTNQGSYWVVVSNSLGVATSSNAILLLDSPFRFGAFSLSAGVFDLQLIGPAGYNYVLETSTNLVNWIPLVTNQSATGFLNLADTNASKFSLRFYRATTN